MCVFVSSRQYVKILQKKFFNNACYFFLERKHVFISGFWKIFTRSLSLTPEKNAKYVLPPFKITHLLTISISPLSREIFFSWDFHWNFNWKNISRNFCLLQKGIFSFVKIIDFKYTICQLDCCGWHTSVQTKLIMYARVFCKVTSTFFVCDVYIAIKN